MALKYLKSAGGTWSAASTWSATGAAGVDNAGTPTAADNCIAELLSGNLTLDTGALCRSFDETSGTGAYTGTITQSASGTWTIGDGTSGAGNVGLKFNAAATFTRGASASITFVSTNGTAQTITCAGEDLPATTFNGVGGSWTLSDAFSASGVLVTLTAGTLTTGALTHTWGNFTTTGAVTRALNLTGTTINGLNVVQPWTAVASGLTFTSTSSTLNVSNVGGTFTSGGLSYGTVNLTTISGLVALTGGGTFVNVSAMGSGKLGQFRLASDFTVTGILTLGGASTQGVNRLSMFALVPGTTRTITMTGAAVVINGDVDFTDITISGSPSWTNAGSAFVGDATGNNSLITTNATVAATQTATGTASFTWSTHGWTTRVPLPQDDVVINNAFVAGRTITADMPRLGKSIDCSGATGSPIFLTSTAIFSFGSLAFSLGMTCTGTNAWTLAGRGSYNITSAGVSIVNPITISNIGGTTTLIDAFATTAALTVSDGTLATGNFAITCLSFAAVTRTCVLNFGSSTITFTGTGTIYTDNAATTTTNGGSAALVVSIASTSSRTVLSRSAGGFASLTYTVANSPGALVLTTPGATAYTTMNIAPGRSLNLQATRTFTTTTPNINGTVNGYNYMPGVAAHYISAPDSAGLSVAGDHTVLCRVAMDDWTPATISTLVSKWDDTGNQKSYLLRVNTTGTLRVDLSGDGSATSAGSSSIAPTIADGATLWVLYSWRDSDNRLQFFTADGSIANPVASDFTQLGADSSASAVGIFNSTALLNIGTYNVGATNPAAGKFYRVKVYDGVFSTAAFTGTLQFDSDLTAKTVGVNSFTESSANAATVTINGTLAQAGDGRVAIISSAGGSASTLSSTSLVALDYVTVQDNTASGNTPFYAGTHGILVSGTTNWLATGAPSSSGSGGFLMMGLG